MLSGIMTEQLQEERNYLENRLASVNALLKAVESYQQTINDYSEESPPVTRESAKKKVLSDKQAAMKSRHGKSLDDPLPAYKPAPPSDRPTNTEDHVRRAAREFGRTPDEIRQRVRILAPTTPTIAVNRIMDRLLTTRQMEINEKGHLVPVKDPSGKQPATEQVAGIQ
jgi:hypothetical protein